MNGRWQGNPKPSGALQAVALLVAILGSQHNGSSPEGGEDDHDHDAEV